MKWLQISDLHIKQSASWSLMKSAYEKMLSKEKIDFILVTGDLHNYNDDDYSKTKEFLNMIVSATKIDKNNLIIIPGNHDSQDFSAKTPLVDYVLKDDNKVDEYYKENQDDLNKAFEKYLEFYQNYFDNSSYVLKNVQLHTLNNKINIIALNTALISNGDDHCQIIDSISFTELTVDNNLPTIVIGHHLPSDLHESCRRVMIRVFTNLNVSAYFCGDLHKKEINSIENLSTSNKAIPCIVCGKSTIDNNDTYSDNCFMIYDNSDDPCVVKLKLYEWDDDKKNFYVSERLNRDDGGYTFPLYDNNDGNNTKKKISEPISVCENVKYDKILKLHGYVLLGARGIDGIKYIWKKNEKTVESLAFNKRLNSISCDAIDNKTSAYTPSISHGCMLRVNECQCTFCETGHIKFLGYLTAEDIALQNIFMAEYDSDCTSYTHVRTNAREFAFMGQGEPGQVYQIIRKSILLTDHAMNSINQTISRYIISTCGICDFIPLLIKDINSGVYKNSISLHYSLNAIDDERDLIMPINKTYPYNDFLKECEMFYDCTKEKIAVSIIMFKGIAKNGIEYNLTNEKLEKILEVLDPDKFRLDLRDFNSNKILKLKDRSNEEANNLLAIVENKGFEVKIFSCFGNSKSSALGMLASSCEGMSEPGETTKSHYETAIKLLNEAKLYVDKELKHE